MSDLCFESLKNYQLTSAMSKRNKTRLQPVIFANPAQIQTV